MGRRPAVRRKVEGRIHQDWGWGVFAEFVEQAPETWVRVFVDGVDAHFAAVEGELFKARNLILQRAE